MSIDVADNRLTCMDGQRRLVTGWSVMTVTTHGGRIWAIQI